MHLASISSQEENDRLEKHIRDFGKWMGAFKAAAEVTECSESELPANTEEGGFDFLACIIRGSW